MRKGVYYACSWLFKTTTFDKATENEIIVDAPVCVYSHVLPTPHWGVGETICIYTY